MRLGLGLVAALAMSMVGLPQTTWAHGASKKVYSGGAHRSSKKYRRGRARVKGYVRRRGGYSYSAQDSINTYGDSRTLNGGANSYRFELYTRQAPSGPFDHGFFFDSGIGLHGGNSPYLN
ncbi:MAG: hypothetical protein AAGD43_15935 [Pseudomonadota bacterium]